MSSPGAIWKIQSKADTHQKWPREDYHGQRFGARGQPTLKASLSNELYQLQFLSSGYRGHVGLLLITSQFYMVRPSRVAARPEMPRRIHFEGQRQTRWCALVVLLAVCSLAVSVATRYSSSRSISSQAVKTVRTHTSPEATRQRLTKIATWTPPVFSDSVLQVPSFYPRMAPAGPPAPSLLLEESLFTRPPPTV